MSPGINLAPDPAFLSHSEALDALWSAVRLDGAGPAEPGRWEKRFPEAGGWIWVSSATGIPAEAPSLTVWLDGRWAVVERLFYGQPYLLPHLREGEGGALRPVEGWEWSCIGLHRLWQGWGAEDGLIQADLRPALLAFDGSDDFEQERLAEHELLYPRARVEHLAGRLREAAAPRHRGRHRWRDTVGAAVVRHRLSSSGDARGVLERLGREGLARRRGRWVEVALRGPGHVRTVRTTTFAHEAGRALRAAI